MAYTTRISVLRGAADGNEIYWKTFYDTYRPLIMLVGGDCNLKPDEKEELVQNVMCEIFQKDILDKFDPKNVPEHVTFKHDESKGRFRSYFRKIVRYQAIKIFHKRSNALSIDADSKPVSLISEDEFDAIWNDEWHQHILNQAMDELKSRVEAVTFSAFQRYAVHGKNVEEVAGFFDISVSSVYTAKSRCISTLKEIIKDLEDK